MSGLIVLNGCCTIQLSQGFNTLVSESDMGFLQGQSWWLARRDKKFYAARTIHIGTVERRELKRLEYMHRLISGANGRLVTDHRDGDGLNNTRDNLRACSQTSNLWNKKSKVGSSSRYKGVHWDKERSKWMAMIKVNGKRKCLGRFINEEDAGKAYDDAARLFQGEFMVPNIQIHEGGSVPLPTL